jgi:hypothetical protein
MLASPSLCSASEARTTLVKPVEKKTRIAGRAKSPSHPQKPRAGWDESLAEMAQRGDDELLDGDIPSLSTWDQVEWEWHFQ